MGGCRCSYKNCTNTTKTRDNLHFFHYPVKQKDRCKQWIENANKPQFYDLDEDQLRNKVVCETHFEDCYFPNMQKKRLLQGAVPTLDGDSKLKPPTPHERSMKIQDVQVLPANADGTIFVLETNMQNSFHSGKVESYIYTNNGLVLPINKCNASIDDNMQSTYSGSEVEEMDESPIHVKMDQEVYANLNSSCEVVTIDKDFDNYVYASESNNVVQVDSYDRPKPKLRVIQPTENKSENSNSVRTSDEIFTKSVENKYVKKIKQHSRDIAFLKRLLRTKTPCRKPSNGSILHSLRKQVSSSLFNVINLNINSKCELSPQDLEFFATIHSTSPQVYQILTQKYKWKLPNPETFSNSTNKNNGNVYCEEN